MRLVWACGIERRQATVVLPCVQASFEDLRAYWRLKTTHLATLSREFLSPVIRTYLSQQGVEIAINKTLPHFGDVVVVHQAFKKPPSFENRDVTGVCL